MTTLESIIEEYNYHHKPCDFIPRDLSIIKAFFGNIIQGTMSDIINASLESTEIDTNKYDNVLNFLHGFLHDSHDLSDFGTCILNECDKNTSFDIDIGNIIAEPKLYKSLIDGILQNFKNQVNKSSSSILLLEYREDEYTYKTELEKRDSTYLIIKKKCYQVTKKVSRGIIERQGWDNFNVDNDWNVKHSNIPLKIMINNTDKEESKNEITRNTLITCRNCSGSHYTAQCPKPKTITILESSGDFKTKLDRYVPPYLRNGPSNYDSTFVPRPRTDNYAVKVTNIPTYINDQDVRDMFSAVGRIQRITIPRNKRYPEENCDYCYVNYESEEAVEKAINKFNGNKLASSIITVIRAPSKK